MKNYLPETVIVLQEIKWNFPVFIAWDIINSEYTSHCNFNLNIVKTQTPVLTDFIV